MAIKTYTVQHSVDLWLGIDNDPEHGYITLNSISSSDPKENELIDVDGEYGCWDAGVEFKDGAIVCHGADGPSGGTHTGVVIVVPQRFVRSIKTESV